MFNQCFCLHPIWAINQVDCHRSTFGRMWSCAPLSRPCCSSSHGEGCCLRDLRYDERWSQCENPSSFTPGPSQISFFFVCVSLFSLSIPMPFLIYLHDLFNHLSILNLETFRQIDSRINVIVMCILVNNTSMVNKKSCCPKLKRCQYVHFLNFLIDSKIFLIINAVIILEHSVLQWIYCKSMV